MRLLLAGEGNKIYSVRCILIFCTYRNFKVGTYSLNIKKSTVNQSYNLQTQLPHWPLVNLCGQEVGTGRLLSSPIQNLFEDQ